MSQPQDRQMTFHGTPGTQPSKRRGAKRHYSKSWTPAERQFADDLMAKWNAAFANHGTHANKVHRNRSVAIKLYRWLHGPDNDGQPKMTEGDIRKAIDAYASDPWIITKCAGRFQSFGDWLRGCPDNVDKQLSRIKENRGSGVPTTAAVSPAAEFATQLLNTAGLNLLARRATAGDADLVEYVRTWSQRQIPAAPATGGRDIHRTERDWRDRVVPLFRAFVRLPKATRAGFVNRAANGATAILGRAPSESLEDRNLVTALAISLWDFTSKQKAG